jgi:tetratricopeptide (TPR) repeat protein
MLHPLGWGIPGASPGKVEEQARLASELDPSLAEPWVALGLIAWRRGQLLASRSAHERAFALDPDDPYVNLHYGQALIAAGYRQQGIARLDRALAIDPILPAALFWRAVELILAGDPDAAERAFERAHVLGMPIATVGLAEVAKVRGDYARARTLAAKWPSLAEPCIRDPAVSIPSSRRPITEGVPPRMHRPRRWSPGASPLGRWTSLPGFPM